MKIPLQFFAPLLLALAGLASADVPKKAKLDRYNSLVTESPFTSEPEIGPIKEPDLFGDYALIGVSSIGNGGYRVTLIDRKKPDERITVDSGKASSPLSIVGVDFKPGDPLGTSVRMMNGSKTGIVKFDPKLLTPVRPKTTSVQPPQLQPGGPPSAGGKHQPRPRVIPPTP